MPLNINNSDNNDQLAEEPDQLKKTMRVIALRNLRDFIKKHPDSASSLKTWLASIESEHFPDAQAIKKRWPSVSIVAKNRYIFDIAGNKYRLIVAIHFRSQSAFVKFVGTHKEYDVIDPVTVSMF